MVVITYKLKTSLMLAVELTQLTTLLTIAITLKLSFFRQLRQ